MPSVRTWVVAALSLALPALAAGPAAADCADLDDDITAALEARAVDRFDGLYQTMQGDATCDAKFRGQIGRMMARIALTELTTDAAPEDISALGRYGRPWQILVALGDAYYDRQDWASAVSVYEEALDDMRDEEANPSPPPGEVEQRVYKRAVQARALSPTFVASRSFRGRVSGLADPNFRTFTANAVPVPVQFETDSADLTPAGIAAVDNIYAYVKDVPAQSLVILGHTDPRGSDAYNVDLSGRRAASVAAYLAFLGYKGTIEIVAVGEAEPFIPDDPSKYTEDQLWSFDRRVEYRVVN